MVLVEAGQVAIAAAGSTVMRFLATGIINGGNATAGFFLERGAGSAAAPPYSFPNTPGMGMHRVNSTVLGMATEGINRLSIRNQATGAACARDIHYGTATPADSLGKNGDVYIRYV